MLMPSKGSLQRKRGPSKDGGVPHSLESASREAYLVQLSDAPPVP